MNTKQEEKPLSTNPAVLAYQNKLSDLQQAVKNDQKSESARRNYGVALYATGDYKGAIEQYKKLIELNPKDATVYNNLANAYRDNGAIDEAVSTYEKAIAVDATYVNAYANLANIQLYTKNDAAAAIATYEKGLRSNQDNGQLEVLLGIAYERAGNKKLANQTYRHILSYDSQNAAAIAGSERTEN